MACSNALTSHWPSIIMSVLIAAFGSYLYASSEPGQRVMHAIQLRLPLFGSLFRTLHLARGLRMVGTMAAAGINLVDCVAVATDLCGNVHYRNMWTDVSSRIQTGKPMAEALAANPLVPRSVSQMIHSGEKSGKLAHVMEQVANFSETELKERIADLTRYIEPAMIVVMGILIGGVALALMLPIFTISRVVAH
jgi:type IV pilus assembly protein PilC